MINYTEPPALVRTYTMNEIEQNQNQNNKVIHELVEDVKNLNKLKQLLQQPGINVDAEEDGSTALYKASLFGNTDAVVLLLQHSANINIRSRYNGWNALMVAVFKKQIDVIKHLLAYPAIDVNAQDHLQETALHLAADGGCFECVTLLLNHPGININAKNSLGRTPLIEAAFAGHLEIVRSLLSHPDIEVNFVDKDRYTALHNAVSGRHLEIVKLLLADPRTNVDITNRPFNNTPYDIAVEFKEVEIMNLLREQKKNHSFGDVLSPNDNYEERKPEPRRPFIFKNYEIVIPKRYRRP